MKKILKTLVTAVVAVVALAAVVGVGVASVAGVKLPYRFPDVSAGSYLVGPFETGLALYQFEREGYFYTISPLNDYVFDRDGYRNPLLSWEAFGSWRETDKTSGYVDDVKTVTENYLNAVEPSYEVYRNGVRFGYKATVESDEVRVVRTLKFDTARLVNGQGMTLTFSDGDIVFDTETGVVYTNTSKGDIDWVNGLYDLRLQPIEAELTDYRIGERKAVSVINPNVPGMITVEAQAGQGMVVDTRYRLIEVFEEQVGWSREMEMEMLVRVTNTRPISLRLE